MMLLLLYGKKTNVYVPSGIYTKEAITYSSSIDDISNLTGHIYYDNNAYNLPVICLVHGAVNKDEAFTDATLERFAAYGFFVVTIDMRGNDGDGGSIDCSGRELFDIYDAFEYVCSIYGNKINPNKKVLYGVSMGGGNSLNFAVSFPDYCSVIVDMFGMSDYGSNANYGWWYTNSGYRTLLTSYIGDPTVNVNTYLCRKALDSIINIKDLAFLYVFHDTADSQVSVTHSQRVNTALNNASITNKEYTQSTVGDTYRYLHQYPNTPSQTIHAESIFVSKALSELSKNIPNSGYFLINKYLKTKLFEIRLGNLNDHVANLSYNLTLKEFTITPITGEQSVTVYFDSTSQTQIINAETTFNF